MHQWLPGEEEFSKAALIAQADEEEAVAEAIFEELDRLERVHGPEQADDIPNNTVIEFSEVEL